MPEESVGIDVNMVVDRAEAGMDRLGRKTNQATENVEKLEKRGGRAGRALNRAFNTGVRGVVGINRGILRTINFLASMRTLVLGVFGFLAGRLLLGLIQRFEELEKSQIRAIAALRAAQKRFGAQAGTIAGLIRFIRDLRSEYRTLSRIEINNAVAQTVELQRNFGLAADQQQVLARRIIDTAAATGRTVEDVTERIRSGFLGSTEAIEDLGVNFLKTRLSALAAAEGYGKNFTALDQLTQAQIRYKAFLQDTNELQGVAARIANTTTGRLARLRAGLSDLVTLFGSLLVSTPLFNTILEGTGNLTAFLRGEVQQLSGPGKVLLGILNAIVQTIGGISFAVKELFQSLPGLTLADLLNPEGLLKRISSAFSQGFQAFSLRPEPGSIPDIAQILGGDAEQIFVNVRPRVDVEQGLEEVDRLLKALRQQLELRQEGAPILFDPDSAVEQLEQARRSLSPIARQIVSDLAEATSIGQIGELQAQLAALARLRQELAAVGDEFEKANQKRAGFEIGLRDFREGELVDFSQQFLSLFVGAFQVFADALSDVVAGTDERLKKFFAGLLGFLGSFAIQLGSLMITLGLAMTALFTLNPGALIAIGAALVAIGAVLKGFSSRIGQTTGQGGGGASFQGGISRPIAGGSATPVFDLGGFGGGGSLSTVGAGGVGGGGSELGQRTVNRLAGQVDRLAGTLNRIESMPADEVLTTGYRGSRMARRNISRGTFNDDDI